MLFDFHNLAPALFYQQKLFTVLNNKYQYITRNINKIYIPFTLTNWSLITIRYNGPKILNNFPDNITSLSNFDMFKINLKNYIVKKQYNENHWATALNY